jgi:hypothetical protein
VVLDEKFYDKGSQLKLDLTETGYYRKGTRSATGFGVRNYEVPISVTNMSLVIIHEGSQ